MTSDLLQHETQGYDAFIDPKVQCPIFMMWGANNTSFERRRWKMTIQDVDVHELHSVVSLH